VNGSAILIGVTAFASEPALALTRYRAEFYAVPPRQTERNVYIVTYVTDPRTGEGFIYLLSSWPR